MLFLGNRKRINRRIRLDIKSKAERAGARELNTVIHLPAFDSILLGKRNKKKKKKREGERMGGKEGGRKYRAPM